MFSIQLSLIHMSFGGLSTVVSFLKLQK